jgi:hypothetical protein
MDSQSPALEADWAFARAAARASSLSAAVTAATTLSSMDIDFRLDQLDMLVDSLLGGRP